MFEQISKDVKGLFSKFFIAVIIILACNYVGIDKKFLLSLIGMGSAIGEEKFENPKPIQTLDNAKNSYIDSLISKDDLLVVDEYKINWMTIFKDTSEEKIIQLEGMIDDIKKYLENNREYSDEDIRKYFGSSEIQKSEDGKSIVFVLNTGRNIQLSELVSLYSEIKDIISIINKNSKDIFGILTNEKPMLYITNEKIEEKIIEIRKEYNTGDTNVAKDTAYSLARFILGNHDMNIYHKYIKNNEDLFIEELNVVYKINNNDGSTYALNTDILKEYDIYIKDIVLESKYSTGVTVRDSIKNELNKSDMKYENIIYDVEQVDDNSNLYILSLYKEVDDNKYQDLGIYEYNSVANCIETIYQLGYGIINEELKNKYSK